MCLKTICIYAVSNNLFFTIYSHLLNIYCNKSSKNNTMYMFSMYTQIRTAIKLWHLHLPNFAQAVCGLKTLSHPSHPSATGGLSGTFWVRWMVLQWKIRSRNGHIIYPLVKIQKAVENHIFLQGQRTISLDSSLIFHRNHESFPERTWWFSIVCLLVSQRL